MVATAISLSPHCRMLTALSANAPTAPGASAELARKLARAANCTSANAPTAPGASAELARKLARAARRRHTSVPEQKNSNAVCVLKPVRRPRPRIEPQPDRAQTPNQSDRPSAACVDGASLASTWRPPLQKVASFDWLDPEVSLTNPLSLRSLVCSQKASKLEAPCTPMRSRPLTAPQGTRSSSSRPSLPARSGTAPLQVMRVDVAVGGLTVASDQVLAPAVAPSCGFDVDSPSSLEVSPDHQEQTASMDVSPEVSPEVVQLRSSPAQDSTSLTPERPSWAARSAKRPGSATRQIRKASFGAVVDVSAESRRKAPKKKVKPLVLHVDYPSTDPRIDHIRDTEEIVFPDFLATIHDAHNAWQASLSANSLLFH